jgi:tetratricopeptide (TPR) repeat protein
MNDVLIHRQTEKQAIRERFRQSGNSRFVVFCGSEGIGKSTFAYQMPELAEVPVENTILLDGREIDPGTDPLDGFLAQLMLYGYTRFPGEWDKILTSLDQTGNVDLVRRFALLLKKIAQKLEDGILLIVDHLDCWMNPIPDKQPQADWQVPTLKLWWRVLRDLVSKVDTLAIVGCSRYSHSDWNESIFPLESLPIESLDQICRTFPALAQLQVGSRHRLIERMAGNAKLFPFLNDLISVQFRRYTRRFGKQPIADPNHEWQQVIEQSLPQENNPLSTKGVIKEVIDRLLDERSRQILGRMTYLRQPWTWDLMCQLVDSTNIKEVENSADLLLRTSLLDIDETTSPPSYRLPPVVRDFVRTIAEDHPQIRRRVLQRVADSMGSAPTKGGTDLLKEAGLLLFQAEEFNRALDQFLMVWQEWMQQNRVLEALQLMEPFLYYSALTMLDRPHVIDLLGALGATHLKLGHADKSIGFHERQLSIACQIKDRVRETKVLGQLAAAHVAQGNAEKAIRTYEAQLKLVREKLDREAESAVLGNIGKACQTLGMTDKAVDLFEEQLLITREIQDSQGESQALASLGTVLVNSGKLTKASMIYEQQLTLVRNLKDRKGESQTLLAIAGAYITAGQFQKAIPYLEQRLILAKEDKDLRNESQTLLNLGSTYFSLGQSEKAIRFFEERLNLTRELEDRRGEGQVMSNLGLAFADLGQIDKAIGYLEQSQRIGQAIKDQQIIKITTTHLQRLRENRTADMTV